MNNLEKNINLIKMRKLIDKISNEKDLLKWSKKSSMSTWYNIERICSESTAASHTSTYKVQKGRIIIPMYFKVFSVYDKENNTLFFCIKENGTIFDMDAMYAAGFRCKSDDGCYIAAIKADDVSRDYNNPEVHAEICGGNKVFNKIFDKVVYNDVFRQYGKQAADSINQISTNAIAV